MNRLADKQVVDIHEMVDDGKVQFSSYPFSTKNTSPCRRVGKSRNFNTFFLPIFPVIAYHLLYG